MTSFDKLNSIIERYSHQEEIIKKSVNEIFENFIEKANDWGNRIPIKKETSDGRMITYWVSPEDLNQGKMKGQQNLFGDDELEQDVEPEDSYNMVSDKQVQELKINPLVRNLSQSDPILANRINQKYIEYKFDRDTRDLDLDLDYATLEFYRHVKNNPELKEEYYQDYLKDTVKLCKKINNRKMAMSRLKVNSVVQLNGRKGKITGLSERGFPIVETEDGKKTKCFVDEIADIDSLIEKYGKAA